MYLKNISTNYCSWMLSSIVFWQELVGILTPFGRSVTKFQHIKSTFSLCLSHAVFFCYLVTGIYIAQNVRKGQLSINCRGIKIRVIQYAISSTVEHAFRDHTFLDLTDSTTNIQAPSLTLFFHIFLSFMDSSISLLFQYRVSNPFLNACLYFVFQIHL